MLRNQIDCYDDLGFRVGDLIELNQVQLHSMQM